MKTINQMRKLAASYNKRKKLKKVFTSTKNRGIIIL